MRALFAILFACGTLWAQQGPRGHWSGIIQSPDHPLTIEVDIDLAAGAWIGSASLPDQNLAGAQLEGIQFVPPGRWMFRMKALPGNPVFIGTVSPDGKTMAGSFTQSQKTMPFKLIRMGDAQVEQPKSSTALTDNFVGTWEGVLPLGGNSVLHFVLKLANDESGAKSILINMDQGGDIPVTATEQTGSKLDLQINMVGAEYRGEINPDGTQLTGAWIQGGRPLPLNFRKAVR